MDPIIDINTTLDAAGGANDEVTEAYSTRADSAAIQLAIGGTSTSVDVHVEARLFGDLGWEDWITPWSGVANGTTDIQSIDIADVQQIRVRIVNNDATAGNTATVRAVLTTQR